MGVGLPLYLGNIGLEGAVQSPCLHVLRDQPLSPENMEGKTLFGGSEVMVQDFVGLWNAKWRWRRGNNQEQWHQMAPSNSQHVIPDFVKMDRRHQACTGSVWTGERLNRYQ